LNGCRDDCRKVDWPRMNYILGHQALREELFGLHFVRKVGPASSTHHFLAKSRVFTRFVASTIFFLCQLGQDNMSFSAAFN
jgi:hypothetical protein